MKQKQVFGVPFTTLSVTRDEIGRLQCQAGEFARLDTKTIPDRQRVELLGVDGFALIWLVRLNRSLQFGFHPEFLDSSSPLINGLYLAALRLSVKQLDEARFHPRYFATYEHFQLTIRLLRRGSEVIDCIRAFGVAHRAAALNLIAALHEATTSGAVSSEP